MKNPLASYRRTQRELRRHFDAFTQDNCASCPTPCCRQPARILPTDILLAEASGWRRLRSAEGDLAGEMAGRMAGALHAPPETAEAETGALPCEFLSTAGCTFPTDLRPFGCTTYICRYMHERLDRTALNRIKRLVRELEEQHRWLLRNLHPSTIDRDRD